MSFSAVLLASTALAITGGTPVEPGEYPDYAMLVYDNGTDSCSGTLIAPDVVLTEALCINDRVNSVRLGATSVVEPDGEEIQIRDVAVMEDVEFGAPALVFLVRPTDREPRQIAIGCAVDELVDRARVIQVGWGATDDRGLEQSEVIKWARAKVVDHDCSDVEGCELPGAELVSDGKGDGACYGDGGGPTYLPTDHGTYLVGIISRATGDVEDITRPCVGRSISLRPDAFQDWIEETAGITLEPPSCGVDETKPEPDEKGCGCTSGSADPFAGWPLLPMLLLSRRRRPGSRPSPS